MSRMNTHPVKIKKYGNRRLYDTHQKRYITLDELRCLIQSGHEVCVVDATTEEDITQPVLIQLILDDQKEHGYRIFSSQMLHQLIQYRDESIALFYQEYLPRIFQAYLDWHHQTQAQFLNWATLGLVANAYSREYWLPGLPFSLGASSSSDSETSGTAPESKTEPQAEIIELRQKVAQLETQLQLRHQRHQR